MTATICSAGVGCTGTNTPAVWLSVRFRFPFEMALPTDDAILIALTAGWLGFATLPVTLVTLPNKTNDTGADELNNRRRRLDIGVSIDN